MHVTVFAFMKTSLNMLTIPLEKLNLRSGQKILDLGCGTGRHLHRLYYENEALTVIGLDLNLHDLRETRNWFDQHPDSEEKAEKRHYGLVCADAVHLPFAMNSFDTILISEVLEHLPDWTLALTEVRRILKPGGKLAISVPRFWPEWFCWRLSREYHNELGGHIRIFHGKEIADHLHKFGFRRSKSGYVHGLHSPYWWLQCLFWDSKSNSRLVDSYRKFLEWDIMKGPALTKWLASIADPIMGKSIYYLFEADKSNKK